MAFKMLAFSKKRIYGKQQLSDFARSSLSQEIFSELLSQSAYEEIAHLVKAIVHKDTFSLIDRFEKMALVESLDDIRFQEAFVLSLYDLSDHFDENFINFAHMLTEMNANKWTIMTYFCSFFILINIFL